MRNPEQARQVIEQLNAEGVSWALDDFGTGYSSLAYLQQFPIHRLKIDRVFLEADARNRAHGTITAAIIELAHALHLEVVAEGVETAAQLAMLTRG
jgi:EAL domain-containing protein (putative c-di-GMP-specific phosphodiesterase class I)